ncbi:MAG: chitinase [Betaproteobacteria bacterium]
MEYLLVYLGVLVGLSGPLGLLRQHELRDYAQRLPDCHPYLRHGAGFWRDAWWQLHCSLQLVHPPHIAIEPRIAHDRFYRFLEATWMLQQLPWALLFFAWGGWGLVCWGVCARVSAGVLGHWLIGYLHDFTNPSGNTYPISQVSANWDVIVVSFADNAGNGNISFTVDPNAGTEAQFIADIKAKRAAGKKVVLSVGGQNGSITLDNATMVTNFVNSAYALIQKYGFDGIDLDLENGITSGAAIQANLITAVKQLKAKVGSSFYLSMAPEHPYVQGGYITFAGIWGAYLPIIDGLRNELTVLHVQYYNNGSFTYDNASNQMVSEGTVDGLVAGSLMLIEGFKTNYGAGWQFVGLRPDQVAFGVPSGPSSANTGFVTSTVVANTLNCLTRLTNCGTIKPAKAYPTFLGAMTWSINWDKHDGYNFSTPTKAALNTLP